MMTIKWLGPKLTLALAGLALAVGSGIDGDKSSAADGSTNTVTTNTQSLSTPPAADLAPAQKIEPVAVQTSVGVDEVIKLAEANVEEGVIIAFIENSTVAYDPSVDEILYLNDIGISSKVISAMIQRGRVLRELAAKANASDKSSAAALAQPQMAGSNAPTLLVANPPATGSIIVQTAGQSMVSAPLQADPNSPYAYGVESAPTAWAPAPQPAAVGQFYDTLSPYGSWMDLPDYGWAWQPSVQVVDPGWRPYYDHGRWLYTDCGWYWQSDYSWGWAPFHYGRWTRHSTHGWVWCPDNVWGPSWVSWRRTPMYCGWAPLPPAARYEWGGGFTYLGMSVGMDCDFGLGPDYFAFVSYRHFGDRYPRQYYLPQDQAHNVYKQSTVINKYYLGPNKTVINEGIGKDQIAAFTRTEPRKIAIRDMTPAAGKFVKPDRLEKDGNSMVIYRPSLQQMKPAATTLAPAKGLADKNTPAVTPGSSSPITRLPQPVSFADKTLRSTQTKAQAVPRSAATLSSPATTPEMVTHSMSGGVPVTTVSPAVATSNLRERGPLPLSPAPAYTTFNPEPAKIAAPPGAPQSRVISSNPLATVPPPKVVETRGTPTPNQANSFRPPQNSGSSLPMPNRVLTQPPSATPRVTTPSQSQPAASGRFFRQEVAKPYPDSGSAPYVSPPSSYTPSAPPSSAVPNLRTLPSVSQSPAPRSRQPSISVPTPPSSSYRPVETRSIQPPVTTVRPITPPPPAYRPIESAPVRSAPSPSYRSMESAPVRSSPPPSVSIAPSSSPRPVEAPRSAPSAPPKSNPDSSKDRK